MILQPITLVECLKISKEIDDGDGDDERSTFYYDIAMHHRCHCFAIMYHDNEIGFVVIKEAAGGLMLFWESLRKPYRRNKLGGRAGYLGMKKAFDMGAKVLQSDVFVTNTNSISIHLGIMKSEGIERAISVKGKSIDVEHFRMTKKMFDDAVNRFHWVKQ